LNTVFFVYLIASEISFLNVIETGTGLFRRQSPHWSWSILN